MDVYSLKVIAKYTGAKYTKVGELPFTVTVDDHCVDATLTFDPTVTPSSPIIYFIGHQDFEHTFEVAKISSTESDCPSYSFSLESLAVPQPDPQIYTFDETDFKMKISSTIQS
jgi:hypothetical protein